MMSRDYVTLHGAEDVRSAAHTISTAADTMRSAAGTIDYALEQQRRFLDDWMTRFEAAVEKLAAPQISADLGRPCHMGE